MKPSTKPPEEIGQLRITIANLTESEAAEMALETINRMAWLSQVEINILLLLIKNGEMFGKEMVDASNGILKMQCIFTFLCRMKKKGLIEEIEERSPEPGESGHKRVYYRISKIGRSAIRVYLLLGWCLALENEGSVTPPDRSI